MVTSNRWLEIVDIATAHARGYLAIWAPNTQRKCMAEVEQNKIERVLAYREQVPPDPVVFLKVSSAILISCFSSTNFTGPAFHRCLVLKPGSYNALYYGGLKSNNCIPNRFWTSIADQIIGISQVQRSLEEKYRMIYYLANFHFRCWFLRPANCLYKQLRVAQISSTESKDIKCHTSVSFNEMSYSWAKTGIFQQIPPCLVSKQS